MDQRAPPVPVMVLEAFGLAPEETLIECWGSGHIHDTYRVTPLAGGAAPRLLLQRINAGVFPDPVAVTETIRRVTDHLRAKSRAHAADRGVPDLVSTTDGAVVARDTQGAYWRAFRFVEGTRTYDVVASPAMARRAAHAFGAFQRELADLPPPRLPETLPGFHDTPARLRALRAAVEADVAGRVRLCEREIEAALSREPSAGVLLDAHHAGNIPERTTHGDTKINNVLFDERTGQAVCVIDLDTVMPGLGVHDFGDMVRTASCRAPEDERDLCRVAAEPDLVVALAEGYLAALGDLASPHERGLLATAGEIVTLEIGARFLTDFLEGDVYFKVSRPDQNLDRCRSQLALLGSLEGQRDALRERIDAIGR